jgi:hypothetical protein
MHTIRLNNVTDFYFQELNLVKSCGQFFCDGTHDIDIPCPGLGGTQHATPVFAIEGFFVIEEPDGMRGMLVKFRSAEMAKSFVHENVLTAGPNNAGSLVSSLELIKSAEILLAKYRTAGIPFSMHAWYKPMLKRE